MSSIGPQISPHLLQAAPTRDKKKEEQYSTLSHPQAGPQVRNENFTTSPESQQEDADEYMPALPPDLAAQQRKLGPKLPAPTSHARYEDEDLSDSEAVGPMPAPASSQGNPAHDAVREFVEREERRRKADEEAGNSKKLQREQWMLVPPSSNVLGSLDPTKLKARQFLRSAKSASAQRDNSLWTETPAERQARLKDEVEGKRRRATEVTDADNDFERSDPKRRKYEADVKAQVDEYNRQTRGQSLVNMHQSSKSKGDDKNQDLPVIWDHARDMSVGGRLMDEEQRSKMISDARALNSRFAKGNSGAFL